MKKGRKLISKIINFLIMVTMLFIVITGMQDTMLEVYNDEEIRYQLITDLKKTTTLSQLSELEKVSTINYEEGTVTVELVNNDEKEISIRATGKYQINEDSIQLLEFKTENLLHKYFVMSKGIACLVFILLIIIDCCIELKKILKTEN